MHKKFYSIRWLKTLNIFPFSRIKKNANYAEIGRVGKLETDFQQCPCSYIFWKFQNIVVKHQPLKIRKEK